MAGNKKIVGLWQDGVESEGVPSDATDLESETSRATGSAGQDGAGADVAEPALQAYADDDSTIYDMNDDEAVHAGRNWPLLLLGAVGLAWSLWFGWAATGGGDRLPTALEWPDVVVGWASVVVLIVLIALFLQRNARAELSRYGRVTRGLDDANVRLAARLATTTADLDAARAQLAGHLTDLDNHAAATLTRMEAQRIGLRAEIDACVAAEASLARASDHALDRAQALIVNLPRIENVAQRAADALGQAGTMAHRHGAALEAQMASVSEHGTHVSGSILNAIKGLNDELQLVQSVTRDTEKRLIATTEQVGEAAVAALSETRAAVDQSRQMFAAERDGLAAYVLSASEGAEGTLARVRAETEAVVGALTDRVRSLGSDLDSHRDTAARITGDLDRDVAVVSAQFASLAETAPRDLARLLTAVETTQGRSAALSDALSSGGDHAERLIERAELALTALNAVAREVDETLPAALGRLDDRSVQSLSALSALQPLLDGQAERATELAGHLSRAEAATAAQRATIAMLETDTAANLDRYHATADALSQRLAAIAQELDGAIAARESRLQAVVETLRNDVDLALRGLADAADMAVADVQERLRGLSEQGFTDAMRSELDGRLASFAAQSRMTLENATQNADTLLSRLGALEASSAQVAARVREADEALAQSDRERLASQVALLTDSLKSIAIDVTKVLSVEVTDTAWEAYLKGDRGVFARRAVRLLDTAESREIMRHYNADAEFRSHVNHFIRDFEAMLRLLIGARDGSALSVTLLSSDIGKLYVALAQAIDRLRT